MAVNRIDMILGFKPDTQALKSEIASLQKLLSQIGSGVKPMSMGVSVKDIKEASAAAQELQRHLNRATDFNTGELNMKAFQASLQASGKTLSQYSTQLLKVGGDGEKAFLALNQSLLRANMNIRKSNGLLAEFATTLKNTVKWQISSSLIHGFMGAIQKATDYAKELDKSLNNIRIVTGYGVEEMARFAKEANKAAQALSTSTTKYTDASLIYYQQGLNVREVQERANVTIKMANVTGEAISEVSNQLTAIWNNFDDGTKHLEYYADVITALGAATASSTEEITTGLEKFAAIGETIGLSYEYATSALATVTAETRQSAEVVGTAFKTIFARIQGLSLGETLDDGTSLNKYSEALASVGISIKTQNGELKDMDSILDEMGAKWGSLNRDQQVALAQTVAGVRQYNQLIALMDNWGDVMQSNLATVANSGGALQKQQETYEDSWAASSQRVQASLQRIYDSLIDEEFFKDFNNGLSKILNTIGVFSESLGGMEGILLLISSVAMNKFMPSLVSTFDTIGLKIKDTGFYFQQLGNQLKGGNIFQKGGKLLSGEAQAAARMAVRTKGPSSTDRMLNESLNANLAAEVKISEAGRVQVANMQQQLSLKKELYAVSDKMTQLDLNQVNAEMQQIQSLGEEIALLAEKQEIVKNTTATLINEAGYRNNSSQYQETVNEDEKGRQFYTTQNLIDSERKAAIYRANSLAGQENAFSYDKGGNTYMAINDEARAKVTSQILADTQKLVQVENEANLLIKEKSKITAEIDRITKSGAEEERKKIPVLVEQGQMIKARLGIIQKENGFTNKAIRDTNILSQEVAKRVRANENVLTVVGKENSLVQQVINSTKERLGIEEKVKAMKAQQARLVDNIKTKADNLKAGMASYSNAFATGLQTFSSVAFALNSISNLTSMIGDDTVSWTQKLLTASMALGTIVAAYRSLRVLMEALNTAQALNLVMTKADSAEVKAELVTRLKNLELEELTSLAKTVGLSTEEIEVGVLKEQMRLQVALMEQEHLGAAAQALGVGLEGKETKEIKEQLMAKIMSLSAEETLTLSQTAGTGLEVAETEELKKQLALRIANQVAEGNLNKEQAGDIVSKTGLNKSKKINKTTIKGSLYALAAVAVIFATTKALEGLEKQYNKDAIAAEKAAEAAELANAQYEKASQAYDNLKNTVSSYEDAKNGLNSLTEGTVAYTEQLIKANEAARELIEAGDLVYGKDYKYDENGLIKFYDGAIEKTQAATMNELKAAEAHKIYAQQESNDAALKARITDFNRNTITSSASDTIFSADTGNEATSIATGIGGYAAGGALAGAALGSFIPVLGNGIGAVIGAGIGAITGAIMTIPAALEEGQQTTQEIKALDTLAKAYREQGEVVLEESNMKALLEAEGINKDLIDSLTDNIDETRELVQAMDANTSAQIATYKAIVEQSNKDDVFYNSLDEGEQATLDSIVATRLAEEGNNKGQTAYYTGKAKELFEDGDEDFYKEYMDLVYGSGWEKKYRVTHMIGQAATIQELNDNGDWVNLDGQEDNFLSNDEAIAEYAKRKAAQISNEDKVKLNEINKVGAFISDGVTRADSDAIDEIKVALAEGRTVDLSLMSPEQVEELRTTLGENGTALGKEYVDAINKALDNYSEEAYQARVEVEARGIISSGAAELEMTEQAIEALTEKILENNTALKGNKKIAAQMAVDTLRFSKNLNSLKNVVKDNIANIRKFNEANMDCWESLGLIEQALEETFGQRVDSDFVIENIELINKAAEGSQKALQELGLAISKDFVENLTYDTSFIDAFEDLASGDAVGVGDYAYTSLDDFVAAFEYSKNIVLGYIDEISSANLSIGDSLAEALGPEDTEAFVKELNNLADATKMSVTDMNNMLSNMGIQAKVDKKWVSGDVTVPVYETVEEVVVPGDGFFIPRRTRTKTTQVGEETMKGGQYVASVTYDGSDPSTAITYTGARTALSSSKGSSTSSSSSSKTYKPAKRDKKNEHLESERYLDTNAALEKIGRNLDLISRKKDAAFGINKLKMIDQEIAALKEEAKTYEILAAEAKEYSQVDFEMMKSMGVPIKYDKNTGEILNQDKISDYFIQKENYFIDKKADIEDKYNPAASWNQGKDENALSEAKDAAMDMVEREEKEQEESKKAYERYNESVKQGQEAEAQREETLAKIREANYEKIIEKYEQLHSLYDQEDQIIEFKISLIDDTDYTKFGEVAGLWSQRGTSLINETGLYNDEIAELDAQLAAGKIDEADYMERINEIFNDAISQAGELQAVQEYFNNLMVNTIDGIKEDWDKQLSKFDDLNNRLEHMNTILELTGRSMDLEAKGVVLEGQFDVLADKVGATETQFENFKDIYDDMVAQREELERQKAEGQDVDEELALAIKNEEAAYEKMIAAQEELRDAWADAAEKAREILENTYELIKQEQENTFTNGKGFDWLRSQMDTLKSMREDTLTDTNKLYETNKLIRTATLALEKTTNTLAKEKLQTFIKQTEELQKQDKLSTYELEKAQAEYAILEAELALEEARNNKSVVRMRQTSEGSYGYIYTADETNIAEAEQSVADAQNALYNLNLEAANNYYEKIFDLQEQYVTRYNEIVTNELLTEEQKMQQLEALNEDYYAQAEELQRIYNISAMALGDDLSDSWSASVEVMKNQTSGFMSAVDAEAQALSQSLNGSLAMTITNSMRIDLKDFNETGENWLQRVGDAWTTYGKRIKEISGSDENSVPSRITDIKNKTKEVTDESEKLANYLDPNTRDGFVSKIKKGYEDAWTATQGYFNKLSDEISKALTNIGNLITLINSINKTKIDPVIKEPVVEEKPKVEETTYVSDNTTSYDDTTDSSDYEYANYSFGSDGYYDANGNFTPYETSSYQGGYIGGILYYTQQGSLMAHVPNKTVPSGKLYRAATSEAVLDSHGETYYPIYDKENNRYLVKASSVSGLNTMDFSGSSGQFGLKTGGYTGEWGPEGKWALLHEKELVLNKDDTKNILKAVELAQEHSIDKTKEYADKNYEELEGSLTKAFKEAIGDDQKGIKGFSKEGTGAVGAVNAKFNDPNAGEITAESELGTEAGLIQLTEKTILLVRELEQAFSDISENFVFENTGKGGPDAQTLGSMVSPEGKGHVTSPYGYRIHPVYKTRKFHSGIDYRAAEGADIKALAGGEVTMAKYNGGYGNCIMIRHANGYSTLYAHASKLNVGVGDIVEAGKVIAQAGSTGVSTASHLHFEVRDPNGNDIDPVGVFNIDGFIYPYKQVKALEEMFNGKYKIKLREGIDEAPQYAAGTFGTVRDGWAITDESWIGNEITLAAGKKGQLQYLKMGSAVMPADISKNLVQWGKFAPSDIIRTIVNRLEANVFTQELLSQYALGVASGVSNFDASGQTVDQNVHIVAEFPNVQDRNEIELALSNLVNSASQYAFKN